jgi:hypothetical protein
VLQGGRSETIGGIQRRIRFQFDDAGNRSWIRWWIQWHYGHHSSLHTTSTWETTQRFAGTRKDVVGLTNFLHKTVTVTLTTKDKKNYNHSEFQFRT